MTNSTSFTAFSCRADAISPRHLAACNTLWEAQWLGSSAVPQTGFVIAGYAMLRDEEDAVVAACRWIDRTILVAEKPYRVAGLATVVVAPALQNQGLGARLLEATATQMAADDFHWGVLFCGDPLKTYYPKFGWRETNGTIFKTIGEQRELCHGTLMALPLDEDAAAQWPLWTGVIIDVGGDQW